MTQLATDPAAVLREIQFVHLRTRRLKVLQVGKFYPPYVGGMETVLKNLCEGLKSRVDVRVLVANTAARTVHEDGDVPVTRAASLGMVLSQPLTPMLPYWIGKSEADLLHLHQPNPGAELACLAAARGRPLVVHFHSDIVRQKALVPLYAPALRALYRRAARIIVPSPNHVCASRFVSEFSHKCEVVPLGISLAEFDRAGVAPRVEQLWSEMPTFLFVGRLVYYKGVEVLLRAMAQVPARLWIVGAGPLEARLRQLTAELRLTGRIEFLGNVTGDELKARYHACDVFVLPSVSKAEMFGMVQLEAMACRKPVVATNLPTGVSWVNQHGVTGLLAQPGDAADLARCLRMLIDNPSMRLEMGEAARQRVEAEFTLENMVAGVLGVYQCVR